MNVNVHMYAVYVCIHTAYTEYIMHCMHMSASEPYMHTTTLSYSNAHNDALLLITTQTHTTTLSYSNALEAAPTESVCASLKSIRVCVCVCVYRHTHTQNTPWGLYTTHELLRLVFGQKMCALLLPLRHFAIGRKQSLVTAHLH
jgi:hypothetical protein